MTSSGGAPTIVQSGEITATGTSTFYPSLSLNPGNGVMAVGYGASGSDFFAGMYATLVGTDGASSSVEIQAGEANYESIDGRAFHGQYSGISWDPVDTDCFWAFNEYTIPDCGFTNANSCWDTAW